MTERAAMQFIGGGGPGPGPGVSTVGVALPVLNCFQCKSDQSVKPLFLCLPHTHTHPPYFLHSPPSSCTAHDKEITQGFVSSVSSTIKLSIFIFIYCPFLSPLQSHFSPIVVSNPLLSQFLLVTGRQVLLTFFLSGFSCQSLKYNKRCCKQTITPPYNHQNRSNTIRSFSIFFTLLSIESHSHTNQLINLCRLPLLLCSLSLSLPNFPDEDNYGQDPS